MITYNNDVSDLLLQTKLFKPTLRPSRITRPHLIKRLNDGVGLGMEGFGARLTLVSAPAGFGKTTLVADWLAQLPVDHCAWLSLDEGDNDPVRFLSYLTGALQTAVPGMSQTAIRALKSPQSPPAETILTLLINEVTQYHRPIVLALDDYHVISAQAVHQALTFLLDHLPPPLHLLIATRSDPPLPLSRLRARNQVVEIRADDLRFTFDEVRAFFSQVMGLALSKEETAALEQRTEGWIAGLQLAALSLRDRDDQAELIAAFTGSHRYIIDYLTDEVLSHQPESVRDFLLSTSILERICGSLADAITQSTSGQETLEHLEQSNLFVIPLDDVRRWYRYHHLFAEVLHQRLQQTHAQVLPELHHRASEWFEQSGLEAEAIEHALRSRDWLRAARLIEGNMEQVQLRGEMATLLRWLGALPEEAIQAFPALGIAYVWLLALLEDIATVERPLLAVEQAVRSDQALDNAAQKALLGQIAAVRALNALNLEHPGDVIIAAGREALALLPEEDLARRAFVVGIIGCAEYLMLGDVQAAERTLQEALYLNKVAGSAFTAMTTLFHLSQVRVIQGRLRDAKAACEELLRMAVKPGWEQVPARGAAQIFGARILYEQNALETAQTALTEGIAEMEGYGLTRAIIIGCVLLARVKQTLGDSLAARELLERAWTLIERNNLRPLIIAVDAYRICLLLQFGDLAAAVEWAQQIEPTTRDFLDPALEYKHIALARVQMAQGRLAKARKLLARLLPPAEKAGRTGRVIELLVLRAVAASAQQDEVEATAAIERALTLAEAEGFVRTFVDEGEPLQALLGDCRRKLLAQPGTARDDSSRRMLAYVNRLLASFPLPAAHATRQQEPYLEPPSERELEVLRLIAAGASNRDIADALVVAVPTVKKHVSNIMSKLNASSRTQAVAEARSLGLL